MSFLPGKAPQGPRESEGSRLVGLFHVENISRAGCYVPGDSLYRATLGYSCFARILTLHWLRFGVFPLAGAAASRFRVTTPESNWLNLDNNGFGVSWCSVKNKMF
jgi:hypothetical protein